MSFSLFFYIRLKLIGRFCLLNNTVQGYCWYYSPVSRWTFFILKLIKLIPNKASLQIYLLFIFLLICNFSLPCTPYIVSEKFRNCYPSFLFPISIWNLNINRGDGKQESLQQIKTQKILDKYRGFPCNSPDVLINI